MSKLTEFQLEILARLKENFNDLEIEIIRDNRIMVNKEFITKFLPYDIKKLTDYETFIKNLSNIIKTQYLDKRKNFIN